MPKVLKTSNSRIESLQEILQSDNRYKDVSAFPFGILSGNQENYLFTVNDGEVLIVNHSGEESSRDDASIVYENFVKLDSIMGDNFSHFKRCSVRNMKIFYRLKSALKSFQAINNSEFMTDQTNEIISRVSLIIRGQTKMKSLCTEINEIMRRVSKDNMIDDDDVNRLIELNTKGNYILFDQARELYYIKSLIDDLDSYISREFSLKQKLKFITVNLQFIMKKFSSKRIKKGNEMVLKEFSSHSYEKEGKFISELDINNKLRKEFQETFQKNFMSYLIN
ncbi:hypothetical protein [Tenuibacillus multivorans]|uniref:Uncharacterized protein n=1 Tax=Tenuibacillus multivorans TaxID=237069 RepID=A0A1H0BP49_9BACI|nr:hypothetical protein [Tenuibacillus multivorans]GEL77093.1 hypothetical protein TMU01_13280 [Tenuibacillus multivorans]SDN47335.1 hypothetical protein SAMN05216498_2328 [Tenuibacillus multivorans]